MHRSRVSTFLIDTPAEQAAEAATFWSAALGTSTQSPPGEPQFIDLPGALTDHVLAIQSIEGEARYHLDIETDDVDAEVARLTGLGAVKLSQWLDCHTLRAPGGHLLCVIPLHSDPEVFARHATTWP
ncbi:VOC family protein [Kribbella deserti]|uniref:VOC family protein n=1 Tax=Kribbella deserti TaxID=1926257 RepID=A0ABV6QP53_9ACTN